MRPQRNTAASVAYRLLEHSRQSGEVHDLVLRRYTVERVLHRLALSRHANMFVLKGAMVFLVWDLKLPRATKDLDLLGHYPPDPSLLRSVLEDILDIPVEDDGLVFDTGTLSVERIREQDLYAGVRVETMALLGKIRIPIRVDVGHGDNLFPAPIPAEFPSLLHERGPVLPAYRRELVVAEKFEAMVALGLDNSRMKDFFNVWYLATHYDFDYSILREAVRRTFSRRGTPLPENQPLPLTTRMLEDPGKQTQWRAFLRRGKLSAPELPELGAIIWRFLRPCLQPSEARPQGQ